MKRTKSLAVAVAALVALTCAAGAQAAIYWGNGWKIGAADVGGANPNPNYFQFHHPGGPICDVAVSDDHLYWGEWFGIWRVNLEGPATPTQILGGLDNPCGIAVDGNYVYWVNRAANAIGRVALDGSQRNDTFVPGVKSLCEVAVDGGHLYWTGWLGVGRAALDGSAVEPGFIGAAPGGCGLAVDQGHLYWASHGVAAGEGWIGRASLDGKQVDSAFMTGLGGVSSIATAGGHLYWADQQLGYGMVPATIGRATFGVPPVRNLIVTDSFNIGGVAVDNRLTPPPLPLSSRPFYLGKLTHNVARGTATIDVSVPERGDLVVSTPVGWRVNKGPEPPPWRGGSFRWRLKVWAGGKGKTGDRIRRQLARDGRAALTLRLAYNETGQLPVTASKRIVLRKHKQRPRPR